MDGEDEGVRRKLKCELGGVQINKNQSPLLDLWEPGLFSHSSSEKVKLAFTSNISFCYYK